MNGHESTLFSWLEDPHDKMSVIILQQKQIITLSCRALITQKMANSEGITGAFYLNDCYKNLILRTSFNVEIFWMATNLLLMFSWLEDICVFRSTSNYFNFEIVLARFR